MFLDRKSSRPANTVTNNEFHKFYKIYTRLSGAMQDAHSKNYSSKNCQTCLRQQEVDTGYFQHRYTDFGLINLTVPKSKLK